MKMAFESENLTAEKIDAMRKFERRRKLWKFLPVVEAFAAVLVLFSWLTQPFSAVDLAGEYLRRISGGFNRGVFIFSVVNVLVAVIFYLSNLQKQTEPDLYGQYVSSSASATIAVSSAATAVSRSPACDEAARDKQEKDVNINAVIPEETTTEISRSVSSVTEPDGAVNHARAKREVTNGAVKSDGVAVTARREMVRAVSSVVGRREMTVLPLATEAQMYRRSASERLDRRRIGRRWCDIDDLSSEEFRSTVETFIAGKKKMLRETI